MLLPHDEAGDGPAIVLLHAGIADRSMWDEHLAPLAAAGHRAIAIDLPGFGDAPVAPEQSPWLDVMQTLDALDAGPAAFVGNSFGGAVALRVAFLAPARVRALVLVSAPAPGLEPSERLLAVWAAEESALQRGDVEAAVDAIVDGWTLPGAPAALRERVARMQRRALELQLAVDEPPEGADPLEDDPAATLATIRAPALVAVGELDMPDFLDGADALARQLPDARRAVIAGAGHLAPLERPEAFCELVLGYLAELPAAS
ncbi:MAG: hypothetical protein QOE31_342 [Solirubrobacteraceae bacterium]|jgi:pimeloyl-ACP methyl ester carboxylesterase|nr:hypothetical protein [Solirubrobacteraceae bacterium]